MKISFISWKIVLSHLNVISVVNYAAERPRRWLVNRKTTLYLLYIISINTRKYKSGVGLHGRIGSIDG